MTSQDIMIQLWAARCKMLTEELIGALTQLNVSQLRVRELEENLKEHIEDAKQEAKE